MRFNVVCLYAPNRNPERIAFFRIMCWEWSIRFRRPFRVGLSIRFFDRGMDRLGSDVVDSPHDSSAPWVSLFHVCGVVYVWRSLHPSDRSFSWVRPNGSVASRVDFIGVPVHWLPPMNFCEICPCSYSAQCAVILSAIVPQALSRGPGIWKLKYLGFEGGRVCGLVGGG